jgi:hypothetical protein
MRRLLLRGGSTLFGLLLLYVLSSGPVDYYLGYEFGRDGGRFSSGGPVAPVWRRQLYAPITYDPISGIENPLLEGIYSYQQWCWGLGFRAGDRVFGKANNLPDDPTAQPANADADPAESTPPPEAKPAQP